MKQRITQEQHLQLNKDQSDYLLGWMSNRGYYDCGEIHLTIGIMIEFLGLVIIEPTITRDQAIYSDKEECFLWKVTLPTLFKNEKDKIFIKNLLCDALWEAVKKVLENKL